MTRAVVGLSTLCMLIGGCVRHDDASDAANAKANYTAWLMQGHAVDAAAYSRNLEAAGLSSVLPMWQLARSGRNWRACDADPFSIPPPATWASMHATLRLVRDLQRAELLRDAIAVSSYRDAPFNRCEGGSVASRHLLNNAIDFDLPADTRSIERLCAFWRHHGAARRFGLGFYDDRHIHVDSSGFRTWGFDYTHRTSACSRRSPQL